MLQISQVFQLLSWINHITSKNIPKWNSLSYSPLSSLPQPLLFCQHHQTHRHTSWAKRPISIHMETTNMREYLLRYRAETYHYSGQKKLNESVYWPFRLMRILQITDQQRNLSISKRNVEPTTFTRCQPSICRSRRYGKCQTSIALLWWAKFRYKFKKNLFIFSIFLRRILIHRSRRTRIHNPLHRGWVRLPCNGRSFTCCPTSLI